MRADTKRSRTVLIDLYAHDLGGFIPVEVDVARIGAIPKHRREGLGQFSDLPGIGSADPELQGPTDGRPEFEWADPRNYLLELRPLQGGKDALLHAGSDLEPLRDNHSLGEKVVCELLVKRQIEANGAASDIERPMLDIRISLQDGLEIVDHFARGVERRSLRQRYVNE